MMTLPNEIITILSLIEQHNFEAYVVGGCVRDNLRNVQPHDYDICTSATPDEIKKILCNYKIYDTGLKHGTITVAGKDDTYEITTYRIDGEYSDNRHPDKIQYTFNLIDDLSRRDFTINAMAYNHIRGLQDPFNGKKDLKNKVIKCVGDPNIRFNEDALRILRAIRFSAKLNFLIDANTVKAMIKNKDLLDNIAIERKTSEVLQILEYETDLQLFKSHFIILQKVISDINELTNTTITNILRVNNIYEKLAFIYSECGIYKLSELKLDNKTVKIVYSLCKLLNIKKVSDAKLKELLAEYGESILYMWNDMNNLKYSSRIKEIIELNIPYRICDLAINGNDLLDINMKPQNIGKTLEYLIIEVRKNPELNKKDILLQLCG